MKPGGLLSNRGFTIVETLIVLSATGLLLFIALTAFAGQQNRVEFNQSVRDIQSVIQQTANELAAGYFPDADNINCSAAPSGPLLGTGASVQGTNTGCILLGRTMQFAEHNSNGEAYNIFTVAGLRDNNGDLAQAKPEAIVDPGSSVINSRLHSGLHVVSMCYDNCTGSKKIGSFAFVNNLGDTASSSITSGTEQINVIPVGGSSLNDTAANAVADIHNNLSNPAKSPPNPSGGVQICFASGGSNQSGLITVGGNNRKISVDLSIKSSVDCT
jgi:type II secretory pathway pseudopilin PulG